MLLNNILQINIPCIIYICFVHSKTSDYASFWPSDYIMLSITIIGLHNLMNLYSGGQKFSDASSSRARVFQLNPIVNKSCKIKRCGNKMHQIVQNKILSRGLELKLHLL